MKIVITIDTSIFVNKSFDIDEMLDEVEKIRKECAKEYKSGVVLPPVQFVLSEVIVRESEAIYMETYNTISDRIKNIEKKLSGMDFKEKEISGKKLESAKAKIALMKSVYYFTYKTKAVMVSPKSVTTEQVLEAYFRHQPPFSSKKKNEFPDAFALFSLEKWRKSNKAAVIAASKDSDWEKFADRRNGWDFERTLGNAVRKYYELHK